MASILGLDPFRNRYDVWLEKTGKLEEQEETPAMQAGTLFEDGVLQYAESELGKLVRNQYRSAKDRGIPLGANIDALIAASGLPVEAKTAGMFGPLRDTWGEPGTDQVPDRVIIQAQVHLICTQAELCHIAAFLAGGRGFQMYQVPVDREIQDVISETAVQFWEKNVLADIPPDDTIPTASVIKRIRREPDTVVSIDDALVSEWLAAKEVLKAAEAAKAEREAAMLAALGQAEGGQCASGLLTYLAQTRNNIDVKKLKVEHPEIYDEFLKPSTYRVARFKQAK